ncbi:MAG: hypothetical protein J5795_07225 [Lachnospiraceae bacterium]|nr:hypothetical protein [Lachnospiraceae bacterium]
MAFFGKKKGIVIAIGAVLCAALIAWVALIVGIFGKDKKPEKQSPDVTGPAEQQEEPCETAEEPEETGPITYRVYRVTEDSYIRDGKTYPSRQNTYTAYGQLKEQKKYITGELFAVIKCEYTGPWPLKRSEYDSAGNLTQCTEYTRNPDDGNSVTEVLKNGLGHVLSSTLYEYWENGRTKSIVRDNEDDIYLVERYFYREDGKPERTELFTREGKTCIETYRYNILGQIVSRVSTVEDETEQEYSYTYDGSLKTEIISSYGIVTDKNVYDYEDRLLESYDMYGSGFCLVMKKEYEGKNCVKVTDYVPQTGKEQSVTEWKYDGNGNLLGKTVSVCPESEWITTETDEYEYDADGRLIGERAVYRTIDGEIRSTYEYVYLEKDKILSMFGFDGNGEKTAETHCTYDEAGNCLSETKWYQGEDPIEYRYAYEAFDLTEEYLTEEDRKAFGLLDEEK